MAVSFSYLSGLLIILKQIKQSSLITSQMKSLKLSFNALEVSTYHPWETDLGFKLLAWLFLLSFKYGRFRTENLEFRPEKQKWMCELIKVNLDTIFCQSKDLKNYHKTDMLHILILASNAKVVLIFFAVLYH